MKSTPIKTSIFLMLLALFLSSCTGISHTDAQTKPEISGIDEKAEQIMITNYGYYLFNWIPLGSGSNTNNSFTLFSDKVNLTETMRSFNEECKKRGVKEFANLQTEQTSTCFFDWCPISTTLGIYWYRDVQLSATIHLDKESTTKDKE